MIDFEVTLRWVFSVRETTGIPLLIVFVPVMPGTGPVGRRGPCPSRRSTGRVRRGPVVRGAGCGPRCHVGGEVPCTGCPTRD